MTKDTKYPFGIESDEEMIWLVSKSLEWVEKNTVRNEETKKIEFPFFYGLDLNAAVLGLILEVREKYK